MTIGRTEIGQSVYNVVQSINFFPQVPRRRRENQEVVIYRFLSSGLRTQE